MTLPWQEYKSWASQQPGVCQDVLTLQYHIDVNMTCLNLHHVMRQSAAQRELNL